MLFTKGSQFSCIVNPFLVLLVMLWDLGLLWGASCVRANLGLSPGFVFYCHNNGLLSNCISEEKIRKNRSIYPIEDFTVAYLVML